MSKELGLLVIHGMGKTEENYYFKLKENIERILGAEIWNTVHLESIFYQDLMQENEDSVWDRMVNQEKLNWQELRKFMLFAFADATSLEHKPDKPGSVYHKVQERIIDALKKTRLALGNQDKNIILVAQSLGGQVISNYIWDLKHSGGIWSKEDNPDFPKFNSDEENFLKLNSLRYLFTTGCNIPIFVAGFDDIIAIDKPNANFHWHNYFDKDDVLGWPLKPLSDSYSKVVEKDIEINAGNPLLQGWNPLSHIKYWDDKDFVRPLCQTIQSLL